MFVTIPILRYLAFNLGLISLRNTFTAAQSSDFSPPYILRVLSQNETINGQILIRGLGVNIDTTLTPQQAIDSAYTIYPTSSRDPFTTSVELFELQYHSDRNSSELVLIYSYKPPTANGSPLYALNLDTGPGVTHVWPAATTVVRWGWWTFVKDEEGKVFLKENISDEWQWIAWKYMQGRWSLGRWNGTTPDGWSQDIYDKLTDHVDVKLEVVPLKDLKGDTI
ncbi:hypothetical protein BDV96DRAFT_394522 [Lophiotrema nucula]|uniref:Uncharacterized protein n=1 Tax=Lophiotrema nucula TaxID=690887 RepID=A0A6A5ZFN1_9PLEO|nr:hypothetical protein BDV96DRAFT_394522 [Lophiotrema nucula]